jgi:hypothetical protein
VLAGENGERLGLRLRVVAELSPLGGYGGSDPGGYCGFHR